MTNGVQVKEQVREFYDRVGWRAIGEGLYQNARYEDLRPVSAEYIHRSHLRVGRYLAPAGKFLLDAGSGPIQYPEYLEYSAGFTYRVCLDLSERALIEARERLGARGLYVVGDVARLPFGESCFAALVSLHTIHHLPPAEHESAFRGLYRSLQPGGRAVVVYSWGARSGLMRLAAPVVRLSTGLRRAARRLRRGAAEVGAERSKANGNRVDRIPGYEDRTAAERLLGQPGTFTFRHDYDWFRKRLPDLPGFEIRVWRALSVEFLRSLVHPKLLGRQWLRVVSWLEERLPHWLGRHGQYPM
ncbi:MAG: class I SAM-dependent methyltransferase, partial [Anaerolineales bacterium]